MFSSHLWEDKKEENNAPYPWGCVVNCVSATVRHACLEYAPPPPTPRPYSDEQQVDPESTTAQDEKRKSASDELSGSVTTTATAAVPLTTPKLSRKLRAKRLLLSLATKHQQHQHHAGDIPPLAIGELATLAGVASAAAGVAEVASTALFDKSCCLSCLGACMLRCRQRGVLWM